jgi:hypothetical protein
MTRLAVTESILRGRPLREAGVVTIRQRAQFAKEPSRLSGWCYTELRGQILDEGSADRLRACVVVRSDQQPYEIPKGSLIAGRELKRAFGRCCRFRRATDFLQQIRERRSRSCGHRPQTIALGERPLIEISRVAHVKTVEEIAAVQLQRVCPPFFSNRASEFGDIRPHEIRREAERLARSDDRSLAECFAEDVDRIGEKVARGHLVAIGPEKSQQTIAADRLSRRAGDERQQRDASLL